MTAEDKRRVRLPTGNTPNFEGVQVMPFETADVVEYIISAQSGSPIHPISEGIQMVWLFVDIDSTDRLPVVEVVRGTGISWPLVSGYHYLGTVDEPRFLTFSFSGTGTATIKIMEA